MIEIIATAAFSQFQVANLVGTIIGGIIGNRADFVLCQSTEAIYKKLRNQPNSPINLDMQKAVRRAYLSATLSTADHIRKLKFSRLERFMSGSSKGYNQLVSFLRDELRKLDKSNVQFPASDFDSEFSLLLEPKGVASRERIQELGLSLKHTVEAELKHAGYVMEPELRKAFYDGWEDAGQRIEWYTLMQGFFQVELKKNPNLAVVIENHLLVEIKQGNEQIRVTLDSVEGLLNAAAVQHQQLIVGVAAVVDKLDALDSQLSRMPEDLRLVIREELSQYGGAGKLPDLSINDQYNQLVHEFEDLREKSKRLHLERDDLEKVVVVLNTSSTAETVKLKLAETDTALLQLSVAQKEKEGKLKDFVGNVLKLAATLGDDVSLKTDSLVKAKELVAQAKFKEADAILTDDELNRELEARSQQLVVKAQLTQVLKEAGWYDRTVSYYQKAIQVFEDATVLFEYATFLKAHNQFSEATVYFERCLSSDPDAWLTVIALNHLGNLYSSTNQLVASTKCFSDALTVAEQLDRSSPGYPLIMAMTLANSGGLQLKRMEFSLAEASFEEALALVNEDPSAEGTVIPKLLNHLGLLFHRKNELDQSETTYRKALDIVRTSVEEGGGQLPLLSQLLHNLGQLQHHRNDFIGARSSYEEALKIRRTLARENPAAHLNELAETLNNLAGMLNANQELDKAQLLFEEALAIYRQLTEDSPTAYQAMLTYVLHNLGGLHSDKNELTQAQVYYKEALERKRELAKENPDAYSADVAITLSSVGGLHWKTNDFLSAQLAYREALSIFQALDHKNPGSFLQHLGATRNNLGQLLKDQKAFTESHLCYDEALRIYRELAARDAAYLPDLALTLVNLGTLQFAMGDLVNAEDSFTESIGHYRVLAQRNPAVYRKDLAIALNNAGAFWKSRGEFDKASVIFEEVLDIYEQLSRESPSAHFPIVATLNNVGQLHDGKQDFAQAKVFYEKALQICRNLTLENPVAFQEDLAVTLDNLGGAQRQLGELDKAETSYVEAVALRRQLAADNPSTYLPELAGTLNNLGLLHEGVGATAKSESAYLEAFRIYHGLSDEFKSVNSGQIATIAANLGALYFRMKNDNEKAASFLLTAIELRRALVRDHPNAGLIYDLALTLDVYASLVGGQGEYDRAISSCEEGVALTRELARNDEHYRRELATLINNLAYLHHRKRDLLRAEAYYLESLAIRNEVESAVASPDQVNTFNNLAALYKEEGQLSKAKDYYGDAALALRQLSEADPERYHIDLAKSLFKIAELSLRDPSAVKKLADEGLSALAVYGSVHVQDKEAERLRRSFLLLTGEGYLLIGKHLSSSIFTTLVALFVAGIGAWLMDVGELGWGLADYFSNGRSILSDFMSPTGAAFLQVVEDDYLFLFTGMVFSVVVVLFNRFAIHSIYRSVLSGGVNFLVHVLSLVTIVFYYYVAFVKGLFTPVAIYRASDSVGFWFSIYSFLIFCLALKVAKQVRQLSRLRALFFKGEKEAVIAYIGMQQLGTFMVPALVWRLVKVMLEERQQGHDVKGSKPV